MNLKNAPQKAKDTIEFDKNGFYVDQKDQIHIAPWLKQEMDLTTTEALQRSHEKADWRKHR